MIKNLSPWIDELKRERPLVFLKENLHTDVAIIGGGIAGISTAYYILKNTNCNVVLVEANKIAHGATGHNAGQIVSYFERPFREIVDQFGYELAINAQKDILSAWNLLEEIYRDADLQIPMHYFVGYAGYTDIGDILIHLKNRDLKNHSGYNIQPIYVAEEAAEAIEKIPEEYRELISIVPQLSILDLLETTNSNYIAAFPSKKGCMNSALFTEELAGYLLNQYTERFSIYENSPVREIILEKDHAVSNIKDNIITSHKIILCTNGFEHIKILNTIGQDVDAKFHESVEGLIGYMSGYIEESAKLPTAISYYENSYSGFKGSLVDSEPYFYLTRRPYEKDIDKDKDIKHNLICVGGPDFSLDEKKTYESNSEYPQEYQIKINEFLSRNYADTPKDNLEFVEARLIAPLLKFNWHGLMGYTKNGIRLIGPEPRNPIMMYNLGCNGVGILPSIFGGKKIAMFLNDEVKEKSIFDPG